MELVKTDSSQWEAALKKITEVDAQALQVERVSIWLFNADRSEIVCADLCLATDHHESGSTLRAADFPRYFEALHQKRTVAADDAQADSDTSEFTEVYLKPLGITSMLDVPIWHDGDVVGVVCHEHTGPRRTWTLEERDFAASVAEVVARALEASERRRAEEALRVSETRFRTMFEQSPESAQILAPNGRTLKVNKAFEKLFGMTLESIGDFNLLDDPQIRELGILPYLERALAGEVTQVPPILFDPARSDVASLAEARWIQAFIYPVKNEDGTHREIILVHQDVTERKRAEDALKRAREELEERVAERTAELADTYTALEQSEAHFRALTENASDIITILDPMGVIRYQSPAAERIFGYPEAEMVGKSAFDFIHPDDIEPASSQLVQVLLKPGITRSVEYRVLHRDGHYVSCESVGRTITEDASRGIVVNTRDITGRKEAEMRLREAEERARLIIDTALDAVVAMGADGRITHWNARAEAIFGWSAEEAIGRTMPEMIIPHRYREAHEEGRKRFLETGEGAVINNRIEISALRRGGEEFPVELAVTRVHSGGVLSFNAFIRDISARKQAEDDLRAAKEAAEEANHAKSEFLSRMSHELRTPMNSILGFAQLLARKQLPPDQARGIEHIRKAGRHLLSLINEVLDIARIEADHLELSLEPVPVRSIVQEAVSLVQPLATQYDCHIDAEAIADYNGYVLADHQRLTQVLLNLLSNAVKYNVPGGRVTLSCVEGPAVAPEVDLALDKAAGAPTARLWIHIRDTGPGIPSDRMGRLFVPFERLGAEQSAVEGTGLGLALSQRLIKAMNGQINVESRVGQGSVFSVALAVAESPLERLERSGHVLEGEEPDGAAATRATILYIEDNLANLSLIETILAERPGVVLLSALQGRIGLDLASEHRPDLILLDLHLPDMAGDAVLHRLRSNERTQDIPVVIISADATPGRVERLRQAGAHSYLTKPLDVEEFLAAVDSILAEEPACSEKI